MASLLDKIDTSLFWGSLSLEEVCNNKVPYNPGAPNNGVTCTPLFEVLSVSIHSDVSEFYEKPHKISGRICLINGLRQKVSIAFDPDIIKPDKTGNYVMSLPTPCHIIPYEYVIMDVSLWGQFCDEPPICIGQGRPVFYYTKTLLAEQYEVKSVKGERGSCVTLCCAAFRYAVTATLDFIFFSKDDDFDILSPYDDSDYDNANYDSSGFESNAVTDVCGIATAIRGHSPDGDNSNNLFSGLLLNVPQYQCVQLKFRTFIGLSKHVVAVPVCSPLKIHVDFKYNDGSRLADGVLEFKPNKVGLFKRDVVGENGRIRVRVQWNHAYDQLARGMKRYPEGEESRTPELDKRQRVHDDPQPSLVSFDRFPLLSVRKEKQEHLEKPMQLVEVFSVGIGSNDLEPPFNLFGYTNVQDGGRGVYLFNKDASSPRSCLDKLPSIQGPLHFCISSGHDFGLYVDLKDVEGNVCIRGQVAWPSCLVGPCWYDKRICSVVRGDNCYATLHYTIFHDAVQAQVKVVLRRINGGDLNLLTKLTGSLVARYSNHEYVSSYDKKYYQSVLLERDDDDDHPLTLTEGDSSALLLPLSKSFIAVPRKSFLIIEANLTVDDREALQGITEFDADARQFSKEEIHGPSYCIDVFVTWPKMPFYLRKCSS